MYVKLLLQLIFLSLANFQTTNRSLCLHLKDKNITCKKNPTLRFSEGIVIPFLAGNRRHPWNSNIMKTSRTIDPRTIDRVSWRMVCPLADNKSQIMMVIQMRIPWTIMSNGCSMTLSWVFRAEYWGDLILSGNVQANRLLLPGPSMVNPETCMVLAS